MHSSGPRGDARWRCGCAIRGFVCVACGCATWAVLCCVKHKALANAYLRVQHLQFKLADMATDLHVGRTLIRQAAGMLDAKDPNARAFCAMAKRVATDNGFRVCNDALQVRARMSICIRVCGAVHIRIRRSAADAGRVRILARLPRRAVLARRARAPDFGGHERDHARDNRAAAAAGVGTEALSLAYAAARACLPMRCSCSYSRAPHEAGLLLLKCQHRL